jgi:formylglycine-generating enzyme required for sulfatase activity
VKLGVTFTQSCLLALLWAAAATAQTAADPGRFRQAGVCSRCHVAQVLEWSTSRHDRAGVLCQNCHGPSTAHVANERNEIKPDRLPSGRAIAALCQSCHLQGCKKTGRREGCESCHHAHALFNPDANQQFDSLRSSEDDRLHRFEAHLKQGEAHLSDHNWSAAAGEFEAALRLYPNHRRASARLELAKRRLNPTLPGFEILDQRTDPETGLPLRVRLTGLPIEMVLISGGAADIGSDVLPGAGPLHTVVVEPFYLATTELTQHAWTAVGGDNRSTHRGEDLPVHDVSWNDAQEWIARLNARISGGSFRLPTEAEWEFAARSAWKGAPAIAWYRDNSAPTSAAGGFRELNAYAPQPVGTREADSRGIYDLAGNVWEWCSTLLKPYPYVAADGRESAFATGLRVLRGGGYADPPAYLSPSFRHGERPDRRLPFNGVRLARSVPRLSGY